MTPRHSLSTAQRVALSALVAGGERAGLHVYRWDVAGRCQSPVYRELKGYRRGDNIWSLRDDYTTGSGVVRLGDAIFIDMWVRCRRCDPCLRARSAMWRQRATVETARAMRTWMGTMTLSPDRHAWVGAECRRRAFQGEADFDAMDRKEQFTRRCAVVGEELTKFLKRVRKNSGASMRYLAVAEHHKSGLPHLHALLHQCTDDYMLKYTHLDKAWSWGFSRFKLVDDNQRSVRYVCKYLNKSGAARVRASKSYGAEVVLCEKKEAQPRKYDLEISPAGFSLLIDHSAGAVYGGGPSGMDLMAAAAREKYDPSKYIAIPWFGDEPQTED